MTETIDNVEEYVEELDAIIEEYNSLDPEEQEDSKDFYEELLNLRKGFDEFENLSEEEQRKLIESTEALFFSISLFSDLNEDDLEDLTEWDELDDEDFMEDDEIDPAAFENMSAILEQLRNALESENPEEAEEIQNNLQALLSNISMEEAEGEETEEKTISITES